jgi:hypothetical protein
VHLYHFCVETLSQFLGESGFRIKAIVGKTAYGIIVTNSVKATRQHLGLWPSVSARCRSGYIASGLQQLRFGPRKADAITAYCEKPRAAP